MRTLGPSTSRQRRRIAQETIDIYAPLAHRLGIREIRWQLEDLAFAELHPKTYAEIEDARRRAPHRPRAGAREIVTELDDRLRTPASTPPSRAARSTTGRSTRRW